MFALGQESANFCQQLAWAKGHTFARQDTAKFGSECRLWVSSERNRPPPVRLAAERELQSRSIFLAKSGGVTIFRREDR